MGADTGGLQGLPLIVLLSLVCYRVTRFAIDDSLIDAPRWWLEDKLKGHWSEMDRPAWRQKFLDLLGCPYCMSVWIAAGAVVITNQLISVPLPLWTWLAVCGATMVWWRLIETPHE